MPIHTIEPVYNSDSRVLILGSFPSVKSREQQFFYGHPQNRFWRVVAGVFDCPVPQNVPEKKAFKDFSRGMKMKLGIAAALSHDAKLLILDEPTAGLDPVGRAEILGNIEAYRRARNATIMMVSHSMEDVARLTDRLLVMNGSKLAMDAAPAEVFSHAEELVQMGLNIPQVTQVFLHLKKLGLDVANVYTIEQAAAEIKRLRGGAVNA